MQPRDLATWQLPYRFLDGQIRYWIMLLVTNKLVTKSISKSRRRPLQWKRLSQCGTITTARRTTADRFKPHLDQRAVKSAAARLDLGGNDLSLLRLRR